MKKSLGGGATQSRQGDEGYSIGPSKAGLIQAQKKSPVIPRLTETSLWANGANDSFDLTRK